MNFPNQLDCRGCEERLSDYLELVLDMDERRAVESHVHFCNSCSELLASMQQVIETGRSFPVYEPPPWLATRIIANTPMPRRRSLRSLVAAVWQSLGDPRTTLAIFTATIVIGWVGGVTVRGAIVDRAEGLLSCAYDRAVRSYYRSPVIIEIHSQIESRLDQLRENS